ncbi:MAG: DUF3320 domain-containing protein [Candidatus Riflebacteria bacterium]|nr:DUF3320 domain-containing protein [Candidatus Riflebacteria bacterium]
MASQIDGLSEIASYQLLWRLILARRIEILTDLALLKIKSQNSDKFEVFDANTRVISENVLLKAETDCYQSTGQRLLQIPSVPAHIVAESLIAYLSGFSGKFATKLSDKKIINCITSISNSNALIEACKKACKVYATMENLSEEDFFVKLSGTFDHENEDLKKAWIEFAGEKYLLRCFEIDRNSNFPLQLDIEYSRTVSWAMEYNGIPVVSNIRLKNNSPDIFVNLQIHLYINEDLSAINEIHLRDIKPDELLDDIKADLKFKREELMRVREREKSSITAKIFQNEKLLISRSFPVDILAYNEWDRSRFQEIGVSFVLPNDPAISDVLMKTKEVLLENGKSAAFSGYDKTSRDRVREIVQALYLVPRKYSITYSLPPASYEKTGQKIRFPEEIIKSRTGTCLDITVMMAAALEQMGFNPVILMFPDHAVPAVWAVNDHFQVTVTDDSETISKLIQSGDIIAFDSSASISESDIDFKEACTIVDKQIAETGISIAIDVRSARLAGILPLPVRSNSTYPAELSANSTFEGKSVNVKMQQQTQDQYTEQSRENPALNSSDQPESRKNTRIDKWKEKLLDLSMRNRLLNFRETKSRCLMFEDLDISKIEDILSSGDEILLEPEISVDPGDPRTKEAMAGRGIDEFKAAQRNNLLAAGKILTNLPREKFILRLRELYRYFRSEQEETGTSTLFLALGFLNWREPDSNSDRLAPIILYPVDIIRNDMKGRYSIKIKDEEPRFNETLSEKLRFLYGMDFSQLNTLPEDDNGIDIETVFEFVQHQILRNPGFSIIKKAVLTFFSFSKFLMWYDLDSNYQHLLKNPLLSHLLNGGIGDTFSNIQFPDVRILDREKPSIDSNLVLSADGSQLCAIEAARNGHNFVLQGPPGTGKSQTIANIIADFIASGKKVLFVSEKKAALEVVADRLKKLGLRDLILEIHGAKAGKREVAVELARVMEIHPCVIPKEFGIACEKADKNKSKLNAYSDFLHIPDCLEISNYQTFLKMNVLKEIPLIPFSKENPLEVTFSQHSKRIECLVKIFGVINELEWTDGLISEHPWWGSNLDNWSPSLVRQIEERIGQTRTSLEKLLSIIHSISQTVEEKRAFSFEEVLKISRILDLIESGVPEYAGKLCRKTELKPVLKRFDKIHSLAMERADRFGRLRTKYSESILGLNNIEKLLKVLRENQDKFFIIRWWNLRETFSEISAHSNVQLPSIPEIIDDLENVFKIKLLDSYLKKEEIFLNETFGSETDGEKIDPSFIGNLVSFCRAWKSESEDLNIRMLDFPTEELTKKLSLSAKPLREALKDFLSLFEKLCLELKIDRLKKFGSENAFPSSSLLWSSLAGWADNIHSVRPWTTFISLCLEAEGIGLGFITSAYFTGKVNASDLVKVYEKSFFNARFEKYYDESLLKKFQGSKGDLILEEFQTNDRLVISCGAEKVLATTSALRPSRFGAVHDSSEVGILLKEAKKKRNNLPIRKLFERIPNLVGKLKPCFMMSPLSVAQFLPPTLEIFDLVIFDEASQITPYDSIGAVARAKQTVIVGDSRQLPPTSFFNVSHDGEQYSGSVAEELLIHDLESILDECTASGVPSIMLKWHYRSRDESLIAFSNKNFYDGKLVTFPASEKRNEMGVALKFVSGIFDRGKSRTNRIEAEKTVSRVCELLENSSTSHFSIGIVTFNQAQQTLIEDLLEEIRIKKPALEVFFSSRVPEPVFVKNLENVQGDERDIIIFSTTYGPDSEGSVSLNFGPLNREGGERRLNVAITRARFKLELITSLRPEMLDLSRTRSKGVECFKSFLKFVAANTSKTSGKSDYQTNNSIVQPESDNRFKMRTDSIATEIAERIGKAGWKCDLSVGFSEYRVDIGVKSSKKDIDKYVLGIELDSEYYASGLTARDRERLRGEVLESLGWQVLRIWSPEWLIAPDAQIRKILKVIEECEKNDSIAPIGRNFEIDPVSEDEKSDFFENNDISTISSEENSEPEPASQKKRTVPSYQRFPVPRIGRSEAFGQRRYLDKTISLAVQIIQKEGPIHQELLARRIMEAFEIGRFTDRINQEVVAILTDPSNAEKWVYLPPFVWQFNNDFEKLPPARCYSDEDQQFRAPETICIEERASAICEVLKSAIGLPVEILLREAAVVNGFKRPSAKIKNLYQEGITLLLKKKICKSDGSVISII